MQTSLQFYDGDSGAPSTCGEPLVIENSSQRLNWSGLVLEKGWSPFFHPSNIVTPYFYFALALEKDLNWQVKNDGKLKALKTVPGEIWFNPPHTPFTHKIDEACFFIILAIEEQKMFDSFRGRLPQKGLQFLNNYNLDDPYLKNLVELFYLEVKNEGKNGPGFLNNLLQIFCQYFIEHYSNIESLRNQTPASKITAEQIETVKTYILENLSDSITIEELAAEVNMSKFYFLKEFKKATGNTPYQFVTELKMHQAADMIRAEQSDLSTIAYNLGFTDQSHFSKVFKRHFNISPGNFRKQPA